MDNNNNNNRKDGNVNEKCETAENNNTTKKLGVVTKLIQEEQVQVMRYKFEKELNCLQGLQFVVYDYVVRKFEQVVIVDGQ